MKKKIFFVLCALLTLSCCKDDDEEGIVVELSSIEGEWVTESHDSNGNDGIHILEELKFNKSMTLYYSTSYDKVVGDSGIMFELQDVPADFEINNNEIKIKSKVGNTDFSRTLNSTYEIIEIDKLKFKVKIKSLPDIIEYHRIIGDCNIESERFQPDYQSMLNQKKLSNVKILKYWTYNDCVAKVDSNGEIIARNSGTTYVYVETDQGIAAVRVRVKSFIDEEYDKLIGINKEEVTSILGNNYLEDTNGLSYYYADTGLSWMLNTFYQRHSGNWIMKSVYFDAKGRVNSISMKTRDDVFFTAEEMTKFLSKHYFYFEEGSEDDFKAFLNAPNRDDATVGITWDVPRGVLTFVAIQKRIRVKIGKEKYTPNYKELLGDAIILSCASENEYVATVDPTTGVITGKDTGSTIIDVNTDQGMVSIHVDVKVFLTDDYDSLIGGSYDDLYAFTNGVLPSNINENDWIFRFNSLQFPILRRECGNWESMLVKMTDKYIGFITDIELTAKETVWFTPEEMTAHLSEKYHPYDSETNGTIKAYINQVDYEKATAKVLWDTKNMKLTFQIIEHKPLPVYDFGRYMGKTRQEAEAMMKSEYELAPANDLEQFLRFDINKNGITFIRLFYGEFDIAKSVTVRLDNDVDKYAVINELKNNYKSLDDGYLSDDGLILVKYFGLSNYITFTFL